MKVASINLNDSHKAEKTGKKLGAAAGFVSYVPYMIKREGQGLKDIFAKRAQEAVENGCKAKSGIAIQAATILGISLLVSFISSKVGGLIGKGIDKIRANKEQ